MITGDTVAKFLASNDAGWDVTRDAFLKDLIDQVLSQPDVLLVVHQAQTFLINRNHLRVKVVSGGTNGIKQSEADSN